MALLNFHARLGENILTRYLGHGVSFSVEAQNMHDPKYRIVGNYGIHSSSHQHGSPYRFLQRSTGDLVGSHFGFRIRFVSGIRYLSQKLPLPECWTLNPKLTATNPANWFQGHRLKTLLAETSVQLRSFGHLWVRVWSDVSFVQNTAQLSPERGIM